MVRNPVFKPTPVVCTECFAETTVILWSNDPVPDCVACGGRRERLFERTNAAPGVIGDEIDVTIEHGLCHPDGRPKRFTSRSAMLAEGKALGWEPYVRHQPPPGTDKSKHTTRWY